VSVEKKAQKTFCGVIVPMVTPINDAGELDEPAVRRVIDHLVTGGVQGIFVLGTAGEGPSTPREMRSRMVQLAVEHTAGRAQVLAGIYDTVVGESIEAGREYLRRGVSCVVAQMPGYYRLNADEQFRYYATLAERLNGPLMIYDIPSTVGQSVDLSVIEHLRAFRNLMGIKDSSGDRERVAALLDSYGDDPGFSVLAGSTEIVSWAFCRGADGFVPSGGNLNPALCERIYSAALHGDQHLMDALQLELDALQAEFSVYGSHAQGIARLKKRMSLRGLCGTNVFLPLKREE
jgi:4-hydroxy-tetrahydrodipicolinate synthase